MESKLQLYRKEVIKNLHNQGLSQSKIASGVGLSQGRVSQILKEIRFSGGELKAPYYKGAPTKLSMDQQTDLQQRIDQGAIANGFESEIWTAKRVCWLISKHYGISYHVHHIPKLLRGLGYSLQKPKGSDVRKDHHAAENWKEKELKAVKKGLKKIMR